jgi:hypothetical protein
MCSSNPAMLGYWDVSTSRLYFPLPVICMEDATTCPPHFIYSLEALWTAGFVVISHNPFSQSR